MSDDTVEEILRQRGYDVRPLEEEDALRGCGYNPSKEGDRREDCSQTARWHARVKSERVPTGVTLIACDAHLGVIMTAYADALLGMHEFGEACARAGWWIELADDCGSSCLTEEQGIRMGYLELAPVPDIGENQSHGEDSDQG